MCRSLSLSQLSQNLSLRTQKQKQNRSTHEVGTTKIPFAAKPTGHLIVDMIGLYNLYTDTEPPRARPGPSRPSSASEGPRPRRGAAASQIRPQSNRDAVGRSETQLGVCIAHPGLSLGLNQVFRKTKRKTEGPQHFAFPEISRENRGCLVLHSGNSRVSLSLSRHDSTPTASLAQRAQTQL